MTLLTDGRQTPILPTKSYWWLAALVLPLCDLGAWYLLAAGPWQEARDAWWAVVVATVAAGAAALLADPGLRRMQGPWPAVWAIGGAIVSATIAGAVTVAAFIVFLAIACQNQCFS